MSLHDALPIFNNMKFEIKSRGAAGRICKFSTKHGTVTTPALLPVINPKKMIITPSEMKKLFGTEMVITNSYIIKKDKILREEARSEEHTSELQSNSDIVCRLLLEKKTNKKKKKKTERIRTRT